MATKKKIPEPASPSNSHSLREIADSFTAALVADGRDPAMIKDAMDFLLDPGAGDDDDGAPFVADKGGPGEEIIPVFCDRDEIQVVQVNADRWATPFGTTVDMPRYAAHIYRTAGLEN